MEPESPQSLVSRMRLVKVRYCGLERIIGSMPSNLFNDVNTVLLYIKKGKRAKLNNDRMAAVNDALKEYTKFDGVASLVEAFRFWKREAASRFDACHHYTTDRAQAYTAWNATSQVNLTHTALLALPCLWNTHVPYIEQNMVLHGHHGDLDHAHRVIKCSSDLVLDVGCGTCLSTYAVMSTTSHYAIGIDISISMLDQRLERGALDVVCCDFTQPLPFRECSFVSAIGVASIHFLNSPKLKLIKDDNNDSTFSSSSEQTTPGLEKNLVSGENTLTRGKYDDQAMLYSPKSQCTRISQQREVFFRSLLKILLPPRILPREMQQASSLMSIPISNSSVYNKSLLSKPFLERKEAIKQQTYHEEAHACFQLFPEQSQEENELKDMCVDAARCGLSPYYFVAWPHKTRAYRWFLYLSSNHSSTPLLSTRMPHKCVMLWLETGYKAPCILSIFGNSDSCSPELPTNGNLSLNLASEKQKKYMPQTFLDKWQWHIVQHCKFARKLVRTLNWQEGHQNSALDIHCTTNSAKQENASYNPSHRGSDGNRAFMLWDQKHKPKDKGMKPLTPGEIHIAKQLSMAMQPSASLKDFKEVYDTIIHSKIHLEQLPR